MNIQRVGVVGLGTMGAGIAEVFARSGFDVVAVEATQPLLAAGRDRCQSSLRRALDRGRLTSQEHADAVRRTVFTVDRDALADADLVVEAIPERLDLKTALFSDLQTRCPASTVFATNTSSLPVTQIAAGTGRAERTIGMHFFNPAPVMNLVEVVHTVLTSSDVIDAVRALAARCGKTPVVVADRAGFVANALLFGYLNDAAKTAETGQAAPGDLDAALAAAAGLPMGPLALLDLIGLDVCLDVLETMYAETRDQRYAPASRLRRLVMAGQLGRKSGRGFHDYREPTSPPSRPAPSGEANDWYGLPVVDGGSAPATAELAARQQHDHDGLLLVAVADDVPLAAIAAATPRPADVVGVHRPLAPNPGVVEVVRHGRSSDAATQQAAALVADLGLLPLVCRDRPGHVVDRLLLPHLGDAVRMVDDGYASAEDVDTAMRLGCGYSVGPFAMLHAVGPDEVRARLLHLAAATHLASLTPAPLLDELAATTGSS